MYKVACVVPTRNGGNYFRRLLQSLKMQTAKFDLFIVDTSSTDGTNELAKIEADIFLTIPPSEFNHGGTRQKMVDLHPGYDIYIFLTQDAYLADKDALLKIISPFSDVRVGAVCGRQLPHLDASKLAQHARIFNYPEFIQTNTLKDVPRLGIKTAFMSNSFAAYRDVALRSIGGFPGHVIFAEDMYVAAKMLLSGWKTVYAGNACCFHSHNYSAIEEFRRYFDMGVFHAREPWIRENFGGAGGEGLRYVISELNYLGLKGLYLWPGAILRNMLKLIAYKLGQKEAKLSSGFKQKLGMHSQYWVEKN